MVILGEPHVCSHKSYINSITEMADEAIGHASITSFVVWYLEQHGKCLFKEYYVLA